TSQPDRFATPGVVTIEALEKLPYQVPARRQLKSLVYVADGAVVLAIVRGDHQLNEAKLQTASGAQALRPARPEEIRASMGASPGSLGGVGAKGMKVYVDAAVETRANMVTGANEDGYHLMGVD